MSRHIQPEYVVDDDVPKDGLAKLGRLFDLIMQEPVRIRALIHSEYLAADKVIKKGEELQHKEPLTDDEIVILALAEVVKHRLDQAVGFDQQTTAHILTRSASRSPEEIRMLRLATFANQVAEYQKDVPYTKPYGI
ncbi:MAG TPA: hypothetical protein VMY99_04840 [Nevskiaceae bacterium]|nr:hypothetical protein [Nevskiaceae bacterium]